MAPGRIQIFVRGIQGGTTTIDIHKVKRNEIRRANLGDRLNSHRLGTFVFKTPVVEIYFYSNLGCYGEGILCNGV